MLITLLTIAAVFAQDQEPGDIRKPPELKPIEKVSTPTRTETDPLRVPSNVTVIGRADIEKEYALNVVDLLKRRAGVFATPIERTQQGTFLDMRGFNNGAQGGQNTLVLVDGRKTNEPGSSGTDWTSIPLDNIDRIEIVRGPAAALYGDTAVAGVINIVTRTPEKKLAGRVGGSAGKFDTMKGYAEGEARLEDTSFTAYVEGLRSHGYRQNGGYSGATLNASLEHRISHDLDGRLKFGIHRDTRLFPGNMTFAQIDALGRDGSNSPNDHGKAYEAFTDGTLTQQNALGELSLFASYTRRDRGSHLLFGGFPFDTDDTSDQVQGTLKQAIATNPFGLKTTVVAGVDVGWESAQGEIFDGFSTTKTDYHRRLGGAFLSAQVDAIENRLIFSGSLRYDWALLDLTRDVIGSGATPLDDRKTFTALDPMAGVTVFIVPEVSWYASVGRTFRFPNRDEIVGFLSTNFELVPQRATTYETGIKTRFGSLVRGSVSAYSMNVDDEIFFDPVAFANINLTRTRHRGIETEITVTPLDPLDVTLAYTWSYAKIVSGDLGGSDFPVTPTNVATVGAAVRPVRGASIDLTTSYVGTRALINDLDRSASVLPEFWQVEGKASYQYGPVTFFASGSNLLNRQYLEFGTKGATPVYFPAPDWSWLIGFEVAY